MENLDKLRIKINRLDEKLINIFAERFKVVKKVGKFKKNRGMPLCDRKRQREVLKVRIKQGKAKGLNASFVKRLYNLIFNEALRLERCE